MMYALYRIGHALAMALPLKCSYWMALRAADIVFRLSTKDREVVIGNMRIVAGDGLPEDVIRSYAREVFRNFAKYLVDFFRFEKIDRLYVEKNVKVIGGENIKEALSKGKGVILLSAHIGNWELGGAVMSLIGYPISGVVLPHGDRKINEFFTRQRRRVNMNPIEIGSSLRSCYRVLQDNGLLALLGDRDFTKTGDITDFFGRKVLIPSGPASLSHRLGSAITPAFFIRNPDDTFTMHIERPIFPENTEAGKATVKELMKKCTSAIEACVRRYPTQWYVFKDIWDEDRKDLRADTII
jgi:KDO2-lipid IV(A) lauroyltransferase